MMTEAKKLLDWIKESVFSGTDMDGAILSYKSAPLETVLQQMERILGGEKWRIDVEWLTGLFYDRTNGTPKQENPLMDGNGDFSEALLDGCSECDAVLAALACDMATFGLCLWYNTPGKTEKLGEGLTFRLPAANSFCLDNTALVAWIKNTPYRRIACLVVRQLVDNATDAAQCAHREAEQDFFARNYWRNEPQLTDVGQCNDLTEKGLHCLETVAAHRRKAAEYQLSADESIVVDALWGWIPHNYPADYVQCAAALVTLADELLSKGAQKDKDAYVSAFFDKAAAIAASYHIELSLSTYSLPTGYLASWLEYKYEAQS